MALEVSDHAVDPQTRVLEDELLGTVADHALGDVDRHVAHEVAGLVQRVEQDARLGRGSGAELDELDGARERGDVGRRGGEDRALGAGLVVRRQLADLVEQLGAAGVVEVLRRQLLEGAGEPVQDVLGERALLAAVEVGVDLDGDRQGGVAHGLHHATSVASRMPAKI